MQRAYTLQNLSLLFPVLPTWLMVSGQRLFQSHLNRHGSRQYNETLGKISGNLNQIAKRINSTGNVYEEDMAEVKAIMDEVWRTQKAMLKKQPLIHNK